LKCHNKAKELAKEFNQFSNTDHPIYFTDVRVFKVNNEGDREEGPYLNEYFLVEDYIEGSFTKWCNNYGYCNDEVKTTYTSMSAFMHWSWAHTKGELMIADLQGVRYDNHYVLTDPAILSKDKKYGITDTGVEGMFMFFHFHSFCKDLNKPITSNLMPLIPRPRFDDCLEMFKVLGKLSAYTVELKFTLNEETQMFDKFTLTATKKSICN